MDRIERILSRPTAKPYRSDEIDANEKPHFNKDGHLDFAPDDIENPKNWSTARRYYITCVAIFMVLNATFASSAPSGALEGIAAEFGVARVAAGLVITLFLLGYCAGPLVFAPLSEFYGRRYLFYITFTGYLAFNFLCAFAPNFGSLLVGRLITGVFASAPLTNAPGVLADVWGPVERANALALFSMFTFVGPALGPVIAGFLQLKKDWRWVFYVLIMLGGFTEFLMLTIPETLPSVVLLNKAKRIRRSNPEYKDIKAPAEAHGRSLRSIFKVALIRPWQILFDPISFLVAIYLSIVYTLLYMLFTIYPIVFQQKRGWNSGVGELPLIGTVIGANVGGAIVFWFSSKDRKKIEAGGELTPEDRLYLPMFAGVLFPVTMFWFAWTANFDSIHWIVPTIAGVFLSTSIMLIFVGYLNYITDTYLMFTASAMAANTICRSACGAAAPLFTEQMFSALGVGGGGSLVGGVAILLMPIPFVFRRYGQKIRERSRFAPTGPKPGEKDTEKNAGDSEEPSPQRQDSVDTFTGSDSEESLELGADYPPDHPNHPRNREKKEEAVQ